MSASSHFAGKIRELSSASEPCYTSGMSTKLPLFALTCLSLSSLACILIVDDVSDTGADSTDEADVGEDIGTGETGTSTGTDTGTTDADTGTTDADTGTTDTSTGTTGGDMCPAKGDASFSYQYDFGPVDEWDTNLLVDCTVDSVGIGDDGTVILALACLALALGLEWALVDGRVSPLALGGCLLGLALALQCAGPASLRAVLTDLDGSRRARASGVGIWLASAGLGSLAGVLGLRPGRVRVADLELVLERCIDLGLLAIVVAVMLALCWRRLARPVSQPVPASASSVAARSMIAS
ncbi:MAG: hypothetical protein KC457_01420 [Myxococcales bacterium]|nr:hypothetical protein [Myxococcales bacterium]